MKKLETNQTPEQYISILLNDADKYMRSDAAERLGKIGNRTAIPYLRQALNDKHRYVRRSAVEALGDISSFSTLKDLMACLKDENDIVREEAVNSILKINEEESLLVLLGLPNDNATKMRIIEALIGFKDEALALSMMKKVLQMNEELAILALTALKRTQRKFAVQAMAEALNSPRKNVVIEALQCLDKINIKIPAQTFAAVLNHGHPNVRETVADILTDYEDPAILSSLIQSTQDTSEAVRFKIAFSLARLEHPSAIPILKNALKSFDRETKYRAVNALERFKNKQSLPELAKLLADHGLQKYHPKIINIISAIDAKAIIPILEQVLQAPRPGQGKLAALKALQQTDHPVIIPILEKCLKDQDIHIRKTALDSLIEIQSDEARVVLGRATESPHQDIRKTALSYLKKLEPKKVPGPKKRKQKVKTPRTETERIQFSIQKEQDALRKTQARVHQTLETIKKQLIQTIQLFLLAHPSPINKEMMLLDQALEATDRKFLLAENRAMLDKTKDFETFKKRAYISPENLYFLIFEEQVYFPNYKKSEFSNLARQYKSLFHNLNPVKYSSLLLHDLQHLYKDLNNFFAEQAHQAASNNDLKHCQKFSSISDIKDFCDPLREQAKHLNTRFNLLTHIRHMNIRARKDYKKYTPEMKNVYSEEDLFHAYCVFAYEAYLKHENRDKKLNLTRNLKKRQLETEAQIKSYLELEPISKAKHLVSDSISVLDEGILDGQLRDKVFELLESLPPKERLALKLEHGLLDGRMRNLYEVSFYLEEEYKSRFTREKTRVLTCRAKTRFSFLVHRKFANYDDYLS